MGIKGGIAGGEDRPPRPALRADLSPEGRGEDKAASRPCTTSVFGIEAGSRGDSGAGAYAG